MNFRDWISMKEYDSHWTQHLQTAQQEEDPLRIKQHGTNLIGAGVTRGVSAVADVWRKDVEETGGHPGSIGQISSLPNELTQSKLDKSRNILSFKLNIDLEERLANARGISLFEPDKFTGDKKYSVLMKELLKQRTYDAIAAELARTNSLPEGITIGDRFKIREYINSIYYTGNDGQEFESLTNIKRTKFEGDGSKILEIEVSLKPQGQRSEVFI